ncbi:MAG: bifunctional riboflavin kinase/FAD synthetase [Candidatus Endonucleobacter bathymodioli]|uniref:Riboflavin biosynthesis protein n=1 Tax=Candidatus Endonucleibacter bathymodioli TaxID=539814 RepID=A0AA90SEA9_9GAMM|nr:bifunctional riboflavin kinase/FAD synthetase [Candidatus Endonucleobacter bathymodioli]
MHLIRGLHNIRREHRACVATIGNFDGVHLGHKAMLKALRTEAQKRRTKTCVITFEPLPQEHFSIGDSPTRLTTLREKLFLLEHCGVAQVLCLSFGNKLSNIHADDFVKNILVDGLGASYLVVGDDFRFGYKRRGGFSHLCDMGRQYGFGVSGSPTESMNGKRISSTRVRYALAAGRLEEANQLLGHPLTIIGRVIKGQQLGRELGYPTANIRIARHKTPTTGVFAVNVYFENKCYNAVANVGVRPTVMASMPLLEVHILDFHGDLYGLELRVEFIEKIRDERKFDSLEALTKAISSDVLAACSLSRPV